MVICLLIDLPWHSDFVNVPITHSLDFLHKMVVENGGSFSMNLNNSVTHCIGSENKGEPCLNCLRWIDTMKLNQLEYITSEMFKQG